MNIYIEKAKKLFTENDDLNRNAILHLMYHLYGNRKEIIDEEMLYHNEAIKAGIRHLDFNRQDMILCAVNALSAHYEQIAFCDGLVIGASLILGLMEQTN